MAHLGPGKYQRGEKLPEEEGEGALIAGKTTRSFDLRRSCTYLNT